MKRKCRFFSIKVLWILSCFFLGTSWCLAAENDSKLVMQELPGIYFVQRSSAGVRSFTQSIFYVNGKIAYCIEPGVTITTDLYSSYPGLDASDFSLEDRQYLELVGYYGYEYPGHQTVPYYLATQELIWEKIRPMEVSWNTEKGGTGSDIPVEAEKAEIIRLLTNDGLKPSFDGQTIRGNLGDVLTIKDEHHVLSQFQLQTDASKYGQIVDGVLQVKLPKDQLFRETFDLMRPNYDAGTTIVYKAPNSQMFGALRLSSPHTSQVRVESQGGQFEIKKEGERAQIHDATIQYQSVPLEHVVFQLVADEEINHEGAPLHYQKGDVVETIETDRSGTGKSSLLPLGNYCLVEMRTLDTYVLDTEKHCFQLTEEQSMVTLSLQNRLKKGTLQFTKVDLNTNQPLEDTLIEVYTIANQLVYTGRTNQNGQIVLKELPVGQYYVFEKEAPKGYQKLEDKVLFEIKEDQELVPLVMKNQKLTEMPSTFDTQSLQFLFLWAGLCLGGILIFVAIRHVKK